MWISPAYAQTGAGGDGAGLISFLPLILIMVIFYFLLIRPQQRKMKEHRAMLSALRRGDQVVTGGGIIGKITKAPSDDEVIVEIAEGVRVRVARNTISAVTSKTEPAGGDDKGDDDSGDDQGVSKEPEAKEVEKPKKSLFSRK